MLLVCCIMVPSEGKANPVFPNLYDTVVLSFTDRAAQRISTAMTARMPSY